MSSENLNWLDLTLGLVVEDLMVGPLEVLEKFGVDGTGGNIVE